MKNRITSPKIAKLKKNEIFVFGSNKDGNHAGGAARLAVEKFGAVSGQSSGIQGKSYGINTMSGIEEIEYGVGDFILFAKKAPDTIFLVTEIGCGIAGFTPEQIAPLFKEAVTVENIHLPESFWNILNATPDKQPIRGFKVFNPDFTCREFKFEVGKEYKQDAKPSICNTGFHFCIKAAHCFEYYSFDPSNIVCEVEALGDTDTKPDGDSKVCTNHIRIIRQLTWQEVLVVANEGKNNTGRSNSGYSNSGYRNSGSWNSGYRNSGDRNSGDSNSGYRNSGSWNSGDSNSGDSNSGYRNSGYRNSGSWNSGSWNSGYSNSGYRNSGSWNSGYSNSGSWNSGSWNSGDRNSGDSNSGSWNSGDRNSGDSNSGYRNSGAFCTASDPILWLFDKPTNITVRQWENHPAMKIMAEHLQNTIWVPASLMTDAEKKANPKYEAPEGYLKVIPLKEAWGNMWPNLSDKNKAVFTALPNFDAKIFFDITGVQV